MRSLTLYTAMTTVPRCVGGAYAVWPDHYCGVGTGQTGELDSCTCKMPGGACMAAGATQYGTNYGFMGDITLPACEAKCEEMGCRCFDFSPKPVRPGENCRICKVAQSFMPLSPSGAQYTAYVYQPDWGWSFSALVLGLTLSYMALGMMHGRLAKRRNGWDALPHRRFWAEVRGLVEDGVQFAKGGAHASTASTASTKPLLPAGDSGSSSKREGRADSREKKARSASSSRKSTAGRRTRDGDGDTLQAQTCSSQCATPAFVFAALGRRRNSN